MVYMYHSFLIHSSADGHLGCFHVLAMINSAAMNIGVHVSLSDLGTWGFKGSVDTLKKKLNFPKSLAVDPSVRNTSELESKYQ